MKKETRRRRVNGRVPRALALAYDATMQAGTIKAVIVCTLAVSMFSAAASDNVHFASQGVRLQAVQVATAIEPLLPFRNVNCRTFLRGWFIGRTANTCPFKFCFLASCPFSQEFSLLIL